MNWMRIGVIGVVIGLILGLAMGWGLWRPKPLPKERPLPAVRQGDGSLVLERRPPVGPPAPPSHQIPAGGKEERRVSVTVKPRWTLPPNPGKPGEIQEPPAPANGCPPVRVDLSLVRMPDQSRRMVASSPDGEVVGGLDMPLEPPRPMPRPLRWGAGALYNPLDRTYGAFLDRDFGPLRLGVEAYQTRQPGGSSSAAAAVRLGIRW